MTDTPYEKNTKEQYEALGRFVEAFEEMVAEARLCCLDLLQFGLSRQQKKLVEIPLYHSAIGAKAVFDIFRAVFIETIRDTDYETKHNIEEAEIQKFSSVLSKISGHYGDLCNRRNDLLHGTWHVGYVGEDPDSPTFHVRRLRVSGTGLSAVSLPNTASELLALHDQCQEVREWICTIHASLPSKDIKPFDKCFERREGQWHRLWPSPGIPLATKW
jgi:hypothetical protein